MIKRHRVILTATTAILGAALAIGGCSKDKSTNPPAGGGSAVLNSGQLATNATYPKTFATAGTFAYHCANHSSMHGSVTVSASSSNMTQAVAIQDFAFNPATVTVGVGATVTWTNTGGAAHTVTSD